MSGMWAMVTLVIAALGVWTIPRAASADDTLRQTTRTIYVTVTDNKGTPVTDVTAADLTVREGGREREIVTAEPAKARMQLALLVEQRLTGDGGVRMGLYEFIKRVHERADIALITVGLRNETIVDYTNDMNTLVKALNGLSLNPTPQSNLTEGVLDLARTIGKTRPERPVIVVVALSGGQSGGPSPNNVITELRQSGATMHAVTLAGGGETDAQGPGGLADASGREQVLGDGSKQGGGRRHDVTTTQAIPKALQLVADDLLAQYVIQYTLPEGTKPDRRLNVGTKRRGLTLRAPGGLPDR